MPMIIHIILVLILVVFVASIINLYYNIRDRKVYKTLPMETQLPLELPIISLANDGKVLNFLVDSGSNVSHICKEYYKSIKSKILGTYDDEITSLGTTNKGITMCEAKFTDTLGNEYDINLSISKEFTEVARKFEDSTGIRVHGLLGTDFLRKYNYVLDFNSLVAYPKN